MKPKEPEKFSGSSGLMGQLTSDKELNKMEYLLDMFNIDTDDEIRQQAQTDGISGEQVA